MNRLKGIIYAIIGWLAALGPRKSGLGKKLLVIRVDEIGDFMLWHSFLKEIATSETYKGYEFHFCGNQSWKTLFNQFDAEWVSKSFWIDKIRFKKEPGYRFGFLKQVYQERYDVVINPTFSRDKRYDDSIVKAAKAKERIGMAANLESIQPYEIGYDRHLYTQLFDHPEKPVFEFYRNRLFTEFIKQGKSAITHTKIDQHRLPVFAIQVPEKYFVVFPGSRSKARIWPTEHFIQVSNYLFENYGWTAVVCGTKGDTAYTDAFIKQYKKPVLDLTGKTSLIEMLTVFTQAECLLSVDTGSVHLAAAVGCTVFGIFNGSQYKRFAPYPKEMAANFYAVYPDDVEEELKDESLVKQKYEFVVRVPYASVKAEKVILEVHRHFEQLVVNS
jgi:ADP-heptose:LPS heptosyltransferase